MTTVTSKTGKQISLSIKGGSVVAEASGLSFQVDRVEGRIQSRWLISEAGNRRIEIALEGEELIKANAVFDELTRRVAMLASEQTDYDANTARVLRGMGG